MNTLMRAPNNLFEVQLINTKLTKGNDLLCFRYSDGYIVSKL